jgi:hypothetical protein
LMQFRAERSDGEDEEHRESGDGDVDYIHV